MNKVEIKFGTDGFRGIIAKDFTFETVERIIKAIVLYLEKFDLKTIIIGYDPRFMAVDFAKFSADLFKKYGFNVILSSKVVPTPIVAYCAKNYPDSVGAIMLTASHNPKEYQGIKFIPNYAGPATKEITDEILKYLDIEPKEKPGGTIEIKALDNDYIKQIKKIIDFDIIRKNCPKIIYDGLYSSSIGYFDKILKSENIDFLSYNMFHSSDFGGGLPEPKKEFMKNIKEGYIVVANDGDADRYGVIDEKGNYISPNIIMAILLKYLYKKGLKGSIIKTVGVSNIVQNVANKLKINVITTPVGFKWLSSAMRENETILAGEDSGGLSIGGHIPEKDGILANLLIIEAIASYNKSLNQLAQEIVEFSGAKYYTDRIDLKLTDDKKINEIMEKYSKIDKILDFKIEEILKIDGIKLLFDNLKSSILIRKSGTEPLLRFYIESNSKEKLEKIKGFINLNNFLK